MAKTESLFPILQPSPTPGLARTAAEAPLDSTGCLTEYRPLTSRSIVNKVTSNRGLPFSHAINPYRGCEFACRYCYARYTHEFMEMTPEDFERKIYFKQNAAWLLEQELKRLNPGTEIAIGTATDPYQPLERKLKITRSLLEVFARHGGFRLGIITKSALIARDIDLLEGSRNEQQADRPHHCDHDERQAGAATGAARAAARPAHAHSGRDARGRIACGSDVLAAHAGNH